MYRDLKGNGILQIKKKDVPPKKAPAGIYERLLCNSCEQKLSTLESYASKVLYPDSFSTIKLTKIKNRNGVEFLNYSGVDYNSFKLFQISLIWRMSICSSEFFAQVSLGKYEEEMRKMLYHQTPPNPDIFPTTIINIGSNDKFVKGTMESPAKHKSGSKTYYSFTISGLTFVFYITDKSIPEFMLPFVLRKTQEFDMFISQGLGKELFMKRLKSFSNDAKNQQRRA